MSYTIMTTKTGEEMVGVDYATTTISKNDKKKKKTEKKRKKNKRKRSVDHEKPPITKENTAEKIDENTSTSRTASSHPNTNNGSEATKSPPRKKGKKGAASSKSLSTEAETVTSSGAPKYSFQVDETDHCETPVEAYRDLLDVLDRLCKSMNKTRATLQIYDPYYCNGGVKRKLASLGFESVINRNRDFYQDIENQDIPAYDVLITNPPYSGIHMEKLLSFVNPPNKNDKKKKKNSHHNKPWLFLLPHFVYTKDYYHRALKSKPLKDQIYFLVPEVRYSYVPPSWVEDGSTALAKGKTKTAPFPSFWYCYTGNKFPKSWLVETYGPTGSFHSKHPTRKLRYASCSNDIPRDFKGEFDKTKKRPNPKARKRAAKKRREAMAGR